MNGQVRGAGVVRSGVVRGAVLAAALLVATACSSTGQAAVEVSALDGNRYSRTELVAAKDTQRAQLTVPDLAGAWGLAQRPDGAGGHFWVAAGGAAFQFLGDVHTASDTALRKLAQDQLTAVTVPDVGETGTTTGVVYNPAPIGSDLFAVRDQWVLLDGNPIPLSGSARHILATDTGRLAAWTEQAPDGAVIRRDGAANTVFDGSADGMAFYGLALAPAGDKLLVADFGTQPQIRTFDRHWQPVATTGFANPFATGEVIDPASPEKGKKARPGDPAPYNVTTLGSRVFVSYAVTTSSDKDPKAFAGGTVASASADTESDSGKPDRGKLAEFDATGKLVRIIDDGGRLNAPWGVAIAPSNFGALSGKLLVGNSGGLGRVLAYDDTTGTFVDHLRDKEGRPIEIAGLTGLVFGNGDTLGDANALYFTAGAGGKDGRFGSLRVQ